MLAPTASSRASATTSHPSQADQTQLQHPGSPHHRGPDSTPLRGCYTHQPQSRCALLGPTFSSSRPACTSCHHIFPNKSERTSPQGGAIARPFPACARSRLVTPFTTNTGHQVSVLQEPRHGQERVRQMMCSITSRHMPCFIPRLFCIQRGWNCFWVGCFQQGSVSCSPASTTVQLRLSAYTQTVSKHSALWHSWTS